MSEYLIYIKLNTEENQKDCRMYVSFLNYGHCRIIYLIYIKLNTEENQKDCRMYVSFLNYGHCRIILNGNLLELECVAGNYSLALEKLLKEFPINTEIQIVNKLGVINKGKREYIEINETVRLSFDPYQNDYSIEFILSCIFDEQHLITSSFDDFGIALSNLVKKINLPIESCAYCLNGNFKSDGSEDLRHGWYCFRDVEDVNLQIPWYERIELFEKAAPNLSAFYWCPSFKYVNKVFA